MTRWTFFLGGLDLEMVEVRRILESRSDVEIVDRGLHWGARASDYLPELRSALDGSNSIVLVELEDDLPADVPRDRLIWVDHHGERAGADRPTSIEQVFRLLGLPEERWTRDLALVAANDRGHLDALERAGASLEEMRDIRLRDRRAQGTTDEEDAQGREAASWRWTELGGRLTVVRLPHGRTPTVTDALDRRLGGPGYENLLVLSPGSTTFFGDGHAISRLSKSFPRSYRGGELPRRGYWGCGSRLDLRSLLPIIEEGLMTRHASAIEVRVFDHIVLWPVLMHGPAGDETGDESIEPWVDRLRGSGWTEPAVSGPRVDSAYTYEEIVYFHPFVRDFLFGDGETPADQRTLRRFVRDDIRGVRVKVAHDGKDDDPPWALDVRRVELYLIRPRVAILLVEVGKPDSLELSLERVLKFQAQFRQIYPPYFGKEDGAHGNCLRALEWDGLAPSSTRALGANPSQFDEFVRAGAEPPVLAHWLALLGPGIHPLQTVSDASGPECRIQQLLDDRMPSLSFIAVDDPSQIHQDDLDRLPACDPPGLDYDPEFRDRQREKLQYTRFRHCGTTYYGNGTSMVLVVQDGKFAPVLRQHLRRHYTLLALIAHYQHAALLHFEDDLAGSARALHELPREGEMEVWQTKVRKVQSRFLKFRTRSYFTEVSNQVQGKDLYRFWLDHMGTERLFDRVSATSAQVYEMLENDEMKQLTRTAWWGLLLSILLGAGSLVFSFMGIDSHWRRPAGAAALWALLGVVVAGLAFLALGPLRVPNVWRPDGPKPRCEACKRAGRGT